MSLKPPPLRNDCFAMPPGVDWTPVDVALAHLRDVLRPVADIETASLQASAGLFLAEDAVAVRAHPPAANTAVDGYGFAYSALGEGDQVLSLVAGRAAAGVPFDGVVPMGQALRVLTGAALPPGVDTVVLDEDVTVADGAVAFRGGLKQGANCRDAGEDVRSGQVALTAGKKLRPQELSLLSAVGLQHVKVHRRLRVAVLSTGDEVVERDANDRQIYDANRPMLLALLRDWGIDPVDLGIVGDDRAALAERLDRGAKEADVILTSGGASAGDEDHVSSLLKETGSLGVWRIALKPGRPLALGMWRGAPVFGLPGNPVAALVCTLVFAAPSLRVLAGGAWAEPKGFGVEAAFAKSKKPGRREYLRARLDGEGRAEVFQSEGSGRISGLSWAGGLVELGDGAQDVVPGTNVRYLPFAGFGL